MFKSCNNVTIHGGTFNLTLPSQDNGEEDFRRIRLGDIHLVDCVNERELVEYRPKKTGRIRTARVVVGARRMYRANIFGSPAAFTVVVYEGTRAEAHKQQALEMQARLPRRPYLNQLFGVTTTHNFSALTYHGDPLPWDLAYSAASSRLRKAIFEHLTIQQLETAFEQPLRRWWRGWTDNSTIGRSTGSIIVEVRADDKNFASFWKSQLTEASRTPLLHVTLIDCMDQDDRKLMDHLAVDDLLDLLFPRLSFHILQRPYPQNSESIMHVGAVYHTRRTLPMDTVLKACCSFRIGEVLVTDFWETFDSEYIELFPLDSMYLRVKDLRTLTQSEHSDGLSLSIAAEPTELILSWLAQANYMIPALGTIRHSEAKELFLATLLTVCYTMVLPDCDITLRGTFMDDAPTEELYLFLKRPRKYLQDGAVAVELPCDTHPGQPVYFWSIYPDGREPLHLDALDKYYPPHIKMEIQFGGWSWSAEEYKLIADVMRLRGYDPLTRDYAQEHGMLEPVFHPV
ncbi:hypothetical protein C8F01DRAFT_1369374 [Mycena amicta]|nr:hypothetical protein C8F01DRAFT_1369374 [Mycena amicta]